VNLLKKYHELDPKFVMCITTEPVSVLQETVPDESMTDSTMDDTLSSLSPEEQAELKDLLAEFADVFSDILGKTNIGVHYIMLVPDTQPIHCTPYHLHPEKHEILKKELDNLLELGIIEESDSPWASQIVLVPKSDGTVWLCANFRKVNAVMVPNSFLISRVEDLLDHVGQSKYLRKLDITMSTLVTMALSDDGLE